MKMYIIQLMTSQLLKNFFFSQKWFRNSYKNNVFAKVNGNWRIYNHMEWFERKFERDENLQQVAYYYSFPKFPTICQNDKCKSWIGFSSKAHDWHWGNVTVAEYGCSCCGRNQYFIMTGAPPDFPLIPCADRHGNPFPL